MCHLDAIEMGYNRIIVNSINYQGQSHLVYIYKMKTNDSLTNFPSERYLDIIIKGCEHFNVHQEYIKRLKEEQAVIPRKQPDTFQSFPNIPSDVFYTVEELAQHNGSDPSLPLWFSINGKILEYTGLPPDNHPDHETQKRMYGFVKSRFSGREVTRITAKALYEPLYKLPLNDEDLCEQQRADIEDGLYSRIDYEKNQKYWKPIGRLRISNSSS
jgi:hypothetical protein